MNDIPNDAAQPAERPAKTKEKGNWPIVLAKISFFFLAFLLIIFTILANMGGRSDSLKSSAEEFIQANIGYKAKIKTLNNVSFFPSMAADFEGLDLFREPDADIPAIHVDHFKTALSFWDAALGDGKVRTLDAQGIKVMPGVFFDKTMTLDSLGIADESGANSAIFEARGKIGSAPLYASMGLSVSGEGRGRKYKLSADRPFSLKLGDVEISAQLRNAEDPYLTLDALKVTFAGQDVMNGSFSVSRRTEHELRLAGTLEMSEHKTLLTSEIILDVNTHKLTGTVSSRNFDAADFAGGSRFDRLTSRIVSLLDDPHAGRTRLDDFFKAQDITLDVKGKNAYSGPLAFENNSLKLK